MKKACLLIVIILVGYITSQAQTLKPVSWMFVSEALGNNEYNVLLIATIQENWWTYSQYIKEGGPIPTTITFDPNKEIEIIGTTGEAGAHVKEGLEPMFDMVLKKYADKVVFTQKIKVLNGKPEISGHVEFMCCDDKQCLAPETVTFKISIQ
jgi:thiol:disulfide interchange protein DsbD